MKTSHQGLGASGQKVVFAYALKISCYCDLGCLLVESAWCRFLRAGVEPEHGWVMAGCTSL